MSIPPKTKVRVKADPAKIGYTTGNKKCTGSFVYWEVDFTVEKRNYLENQLEEVQETLGPESLFESGMFGTPREFTECGGFGKAAWENHQHVLFNEYQFCKILGISIQACFEIHRIRFRQNIDCR